jgi:hypothetical protein
MNPSVVTPFVSTENHKPVGIPAGGNYFAGMEEFATVQCPFCGQSFDVAIDTTIASQCFTTDCEVCCRPFEVRAECENGEIVSVTVAG